MPETPHDEIYVGYLPVPARQKQFLLWIVPVILVMVGAVGLLWARSQRSPGPAAWDQDQPVKVHGTLIAHPYPMLLTTSRDSTPELILLVEMGKHGSQRAESLDGQAVVVSGFPLHRDGRRMIELDEGPDALATDPTAPHHEAIPAARPAGRVTLRGEIIDSKCFLGAMKPGEGKTHKECATLCIRGGIPPMFVTRDDEGRPTYYPQSTTGGPADPGIEPFIADPVELTADLTTRSGLKVLAIKPLDIHRL